MSADTKNDVIREGISSQVIIDKLKNVSLDNDIIINAGKQMTRNNSNIEDLFDESYMKMDEKFLEYLDVFIKSIERGEITKTNLKIVFFCVIMYILFILIVAQCAIGGISVLKTDVDSKAVVAFYGLLVENLTAIVILPKIIAEYLFNKKEEKNRMDIIKSMQIYNDNKNIHNK